MTHPKKIVKSPEKNDIYFDGENNKLYMYTSIGDYDPEWVDITPDIEQAKKAVNNDGWLFNDYNEIE